MSKCTLNLVCKILNQAQSVFLRCLSFCFMVGGDVMVGGTSLVWFRMMKSESEPQLLLNFEIVYMVCWFGAINTQLLLNNYYWKSFDHQITPLWCLQMAKLNRNATGPHWMGCLKGTYVWQQGLLDWRRWTDTKTVTHHRWLQKRWNQSEIIPWVVWEKHGH